MNKCKYTLREHIKSIEDYIKLLSMYNNIDYYKYNIIINNLNKRIRKIKEFLDIPIEPVKVKSLTERFRDNLRFYKG